MTCSYSLTYACLEDIIIIIMYIYFVLILIDDASCLDITTWTLTAPTIWFDLTKRHSQPWNLHTQNLFAAYYRISFIRNKNSLMVQKQRKESLRRMSQLNIFVNHLLVGFQVTALYLLLSYELFFGSQTCLLFQGRIVFWYCQILFRHYKLMHPIGSLWKEYDFLSLHLKKIKSCQISSV